MIYSIDPDSLQGLLLDEGCQNGRFIATNFAGLTDAVVMADVADHDDYLIDNVVDADPDLVFTSGSANSLQITVQLASLQPISGVGICNHSLTYNGQIQVDLYADNVLMGTIGQVAHLPLYAWGSAPGWEMMQWEGYPLADDSEQIKWPYSDIWLDATLVADKVVVTLSDTQPITLAYLVAGNAFVPRRNHDMGLSISPIDSPLLADTPGGITVVNAEQSKRTLSAQWQWLSMDEMNRLNNILRSIRASGQPLFCSARPGWGGQAEQQGVVLCHPVGWSAPAQINKNNGQFQMTAREVSAHG